MPRTRPADRLDALVRTATATFLRRGGPDRTQMQDVAAALGVAKGTLYLYVEGKEALFDLVLRHADLDAPVTLDSLPWPNPPPGAIEALVGERLATRGQFPRLRAALEADAVDAETLDTVLAEVFDVMAAHRTAIRLVNIAARDRPALGELWFDGARGPLLRGLSALIARGIAAGTLAPQPDPTAAARVVIETCMWFAVHRAFDPRPDGVPDPAARATALSILSRGLRS